MKSTQYFLLNLLHSSFTDIFRLEYLIFIDNLLTVVYNKHIKYDVFTRRNSMCVYYDITTPDKAYEFLTNLGFTDQQLVNEFVLECEKDSNEFAERNIAILDTIDIFNVRFIAFHVTASLDNCQEIKDNGIRDLQYVLSHQTKLTRGLELSGIKIDIDNCILYINDNAYNIDYDYYRDQWRKTDLEKILDFIAHRIYYDFCVNGFFFNDNVADYGTDIHKRPEFIDKLIELSPKVRKLDAFWRAKSTPYKVFFYATVNQIHKFSFDDLPNNFEPYSESELTHIKKWMLRNAIDRAFSNCFDEKYIYIRDNDYIPSEQIIKCEIME